MQTNNNWSSSDDELFTEGNITFAKDDKEEIDEEVLCNSKEYEDNGYINDDTRTMTNDNDDVESMGEGVYEKWSNEKTSNEN